MESTAYKPYAGQVKNPTHKYSSFNPREQQELAFESFTFHSMESISTKHKSNNRATQKAWNSIKILPRNERNIGNNFVEDNTIS